MYLQPASLLVLLKAVYYLALYIDDNRAFRWRDNVFMTV